MALDKFFVTLGVKGQDTVLSVLNNVQKKGKALNSGSVGKVSLSTKAKSSGIGKTGKTGKTATARQSAPRTTADETTTAQQSAPRATADKTTTARQSAPRTDKELSDFSKSLTDSGKKLKQYSKDVATGSKQQKEANKTAKSSGEVLKKYGDTEKRNPISESQKSSGEVKKYVKGAGGATRSLGSAVSSLDPAAVAKTATTTAATLAGDFFLGRAAAMAVNLAMDTATNSLSTAKRNISDDYTLKTRNAATSYYGGDIKKRGQGAFSNEEMAQLVASVSGSFGRLQKPMTDVLSKYVASGTKDTGALSRVASGDWRSTGTDKGFFLQKLSDSFGDLPPSIAQRFQARLLEKYGDSEIQEQKEPQRTAQARDAGFKNAAEAQTTKLATMDNGKYQALMKMNTTVNDLQVKLVHAGQSMVWAIDAMSTAINKAVVKMGSKNSVKGK